MGGCASAPADRHGVPRSKGKQQPAPHSEAARRNSDAQQPLPPPQEQQQEQPGNGRQQPLGKGELVSLQSASSMQAEVAAQKAADSSSAHSTAHSTPNTSASPVSADVPPAEQPHTAMVEDALAQALDLPYNVFDSGPYTPPCQEERLAYSASLGLTGSPPPDPQIAKILTSLSRVFNTSSVLLTLCGEQRVWIRNAIGFSAGEFAWRWAFCGWSLAPPTPQVLVIEDTLQDARFRDNLVVQGEPRIRSFAGAPLLASNGHRLGTLCFLGPQPRIITAEEATILANMAELVVRELEKEAVQNASQQQQQRKAEAAAYGEDPQPLERYMMRSVACFTGQGVAFVDTEPPLWQALHCNIALSDGTGVPYDAAIERPFWDIFAPPFDVGSEPWQAARDVAARAGEFVVRGCTVRGALQLGQFTLAFRPADRTALDEDTQLIGVPSDVPSALDTAGRYYFCVVQQYEESLRSTSTLSSSSMSLLGLKQNTQPQTPIPGLDLGPLLGKGSFGRVYRGKFKGNNVAVKVCVGALRLGRGKNNKPWTGVEAVTARRLQHPCVVRTFKHTAVLIQEGKVISKAYDSGDLGSLGSRSEQSGAWSDDESGNWFDDPDDPLCQEKLNEPTVEMETWAVMEYCNRGTLQAGVDKGYFRIDRGCKPPSPPNLGAVVTTAAQLASGLTYLHDHDIIHGDLCGGNILLTGDEDQPHGFSCKVADFGLSRELNFETRLQTASYGTITHMPPELLTEGKLSKAADVFAFGVLLWEMMTGVRAWAGMSHTQVLAAVAMEGKKLSFLRGSHPSIVELANRCMARDPASRPTFPDIEDALDQIDTQLRAAADPAP